MGVVIGSDLFLPIFDPTGVVAFNFIALKQPAAVYCGADDGRLYSLTVISGYTVTPMELKWGF
jgi:hypothetical protein